MQSVKWTVQQMQAGFDEAGVAGLPRSAYSQFVVYLELLLRWNAQLNLTAIRDPESIVRRHFAECAFAAQHLPVDIESLLDFGSGAGLPGMAIAICRPKIAVTLAESQGKKAAFLREAVRALGLPVEVYGGRVEAMPEGQVFDAVTMRAVEKVSIAMPAALRRVQRFLVLLTTGHSEPVFRELAPELKWFDPIHLPNASQMVLVIGERAR